MKKILITIISLMIVLTLSGCGNKKEAIETTDPYTLDVLENYTLVSENEYESYYSNDDGIISFSRLPLDEIGEEDSKKSAIEFAKANATLDVTNKDGLIYIDFEEEYEGDALYVMQFIFKTSDSFWQVTFACEKGSKDDFKSQFLSWAKEIKFS